MKSATVLLLRDTMEGLEVFMVTRNAGIDFAGGALVFPGGKTNPSDSIEEIKSYCDGIDGLDINEIGNRVCGIRETFEEAGFLLAREKETGKLLGSERSAVIGNLYRNAIRAEKLSMKDLAEKERLTLACDSMLPFAHWITPINSPKRYDTWFFLAEAPEGQKGSHDNSETVDSLWINPAKALAGAKNKIYNIVFATRMNLRKLAKSESVFSAFELAKLDQIVTVEPKIVYDNDRVTFRIPLEAGYDIDEQTEIKGPTRLPGENA